MPAQPFVTGVRETQRLGQNRQLEKALQITYMVGTLGPFTLTTTQQDLQSGAAMQEMQKFANTLSLLPLQGS